MMALKWTFKKPNRLEDHEGVGIQPCPNPRGDKAQVKSNIFRVLAAIYVVQDQKVNQTSDKMAKSKVVTKKGKIKLK